MTYPSRRLIVAVDGGGSTCRACIADFDNHILAKAVGAPANVTTDFEQSRRHVMETIRQAYDLAGLDPDRMPGDVAFLGLAGAHVGNFADQLSQGLGFAGVKVTSDREITVQGALGGDNGVVALLGTGSFFVRRSGDGTRNVGGWGLQIGDDYSAAFLGRVLMRHTLWAHDGLCDPSHLTGEVMQRFGGEPSNMVTFAKTAAPMEYGTLAPMLTASYETGDPVAATILNDAIDGVVRILDNLGAEDARTLCFLGGMGRFYQAHMPERLQDLCRPPRGDGLQGAVQLAQRHFSEARE